MNRTSAKAPLSKSPGVTATERMLADFCERSFLKLWSYPNPYKDDGHELCDLLAVFGDYVFIFFDRESALPEVPDRDPLVLWDRWKRNVVDRQVKTAHGAERYIRSLRRIFLDSKGTTPFPIAIDPAKAVIHKIIVAHGAKEACEKASSQNIYGSLAITYGVSDGGPTQPFHIEIDKRNPVHVLDSHNMPIVLAELDTVSDFSAYLDAKVLAIARLDYLSYCGEEDLLAHYLLNYDQASKRHVIGLKHEENIDGVMIGEGEWHDFVKTDVYKNTEKEDRISYFWDDLIQRTCQNSLKGTLGGNSNILRGESAIYEMVREPRFFRRSLASKMLSAVERFPDHPSEFTRQVTFLPSYVPNVGYVLLQLRAPEAFRKEPDYREKRQTLLEIACGAAKNNFPNLVKVIGIGIDAPKFAGDTNAEDFILLPCDVWTDEMRAHYEAENEPWSFFETPQLQRFKERVTEFVPSASAAASLIRTAKVGRNEPCPCGSGKKYKKCHGR
jgi:SEC-C motif